MHRYNKVKKLQNEAPGTEKLQTGEVAFEPFRTGNAERKNGGEGSPDAGKGIYRLAVSTAGYD
jgi:hypothetical protein